MNAKASEKYQYYDYKFKQEILLDQNGYPGSKPPWGTITAINLNNGQTIWQIPFGEYEKLSKKTFQLQANQTWVDLQEHLGIFYLLQEL